MFPEFEKYSLYPKSKGTITSSNTLPMEKQTAIEWLIEQCPRIETIVAYNILEQAKQMEKDQIIDAFWNGDNSDCTSEQNAKEFAEEYYNQTYNQDSELPKEDKTFKRKSQWTEVDNMTKRLK
jgi:hypothetical protein